MDEIESSLREYYEIEAERRLRPAHGRERTEIRDLYATELADAAVPSVLDVGCGPGDDGSGFQQAGVRYVGVDLAVGNAVVALDDGLDVVPASLFALPFSDNTFGAGWSMSVFQHVPDERIDEALAEFVRILAPDAPVVLGIWGGRDEVIDPESSWTGIEVRRHFTLRSHDRTRATLARHLDVERDHTFASGPSDWEYHVSWCRVRTP